MAIYHLNIGHVSRSTGRSSVQSAAYITGSSLYETRRDLSANYENRASDIVWSQTIAPEWSPLEYHELSVWDKIESFEDEYAVERFSTILREFRSLAAVMDSTKKTSSGRSEGKNSVKLGSLLPR